VFAKRHKPETAEILYKLSSRSSYKRIDVDLLSGATSGALGGDREPAPELSFQNLIASLPAAAIAASKAKRKSLPRFRWRVTNLSPTPPPPPITLYWKFMGRLLAAILLAATMPAAQREIVIVDTDSGLFGDDGAAVTMLLRSPAQVVVPGITIVPGNVWAPQGAEYMLHILDLLKRPEVPVWEGAEVPLVNSTAMDREEERRWGKLEYTGAFAYDPNAVIPAVGAKLTGRKARRDGAVQFLISEIERRPGEVTILALGPMTNIALALRLKPGIETKIKQIVFMGGSIKAPGNATQWAEFNFWFDPEAARMVLRSRIPRKVMFPLDVCNTAPIRKAQFDQIAAAHTPITDLFREDLGNRYPGFLKHPDGTAYMWDSLAAAYLIDPAFVTKWQTLSLDVQSAWDRFYGATIPLGPGLAPDATPLTVASELDFQRVFKLYKDRLTRRD
jgi:inosine-uridine nucleoside N-ribohydrolase